MVFKPYLCAGKRYATKELALAEAKRIHEKTGVFAGVEYRPNRLTETQLRSNFGPGNI